MPKTRVLTAMCLMLGLVALGRTAASAELELDPQLSNPGGGSESGTEELKGGMVYRFVSLKAPAENLQEHLYWRTLDGVIAAETAPVRLLIDNTPVIEPKEVVIKDRGTIKQYPVEAHKNLAEGKHVLIPGDIPITVMKAGAINSTHPAIKADENEVRILCAPVRLDAVDQNGVAVPIAINLSNGKERLLREVVKFSALTVWLPVGVKYASSLGTFSIAPDGKIMAEPAELGKDVKLTPEGLRQLVNPPASAALKALPLGRVYPLSLAAGTKTLNYYYNPLSKPGEAAALAFSKKQYESVLKSPFVLSDFQYAYPQDPPLKFEAAAPAADVAQAIANELQTDAADVAWLKIPAPKWDSAGVITVKVDGRLFSASIVQPLVVADPDATVHLLPYRLRTVFTNTETQTYTVLLKPKFGGGAATVLCKSEAADAKPLTLGTLQLPAVPENQYDSRLFTLKMSSLPPGNYQLWLDVGGAASSKVAVSVVPWYFRSDFLVHQMTSCMGMWPTDDAGLKMMHDCGMEMLCSGGFGSIYNAADMPVLNAELAASLRKDAHAIPDEFAMTRCKADFVLQSMIQHQIRQMDFYPRGCDFYLEGLSYHHSFKPSVDRMIRRMQIFTQQTMDYPSLWGMNYSWFPCLFGYSEGGLDTDIHKIDRNAQLERNLKEAGITPITPDERKFFEENKFSEDEGKRSQALHLMDKAVAHWKGQMEFGLGKHNKLYNDAVREVEPQAACVLYENAGHDGLKRTKSLFNDMIAITYESYSDYPEWPMSASFTTDWAKGNWPGKPVWITVDPGNSSEGMMKSMFHAFARGAAGSGTITMAEQGSEAYRRGKGMNFLAQYGAIAKLGVPDHRFAILSTDAEQVLGTGGQYNYHAMYMFLTRLGCAPVIINDEDAAASGIPAGTQVLFIVRQTVPLEPKVLSAIKAFTDKGGKVVVTGDTKVKIEGAILADKPIKNIFELGGFVSHPQMWKQFEETWEKPLSETLAKAGVPALAKTDPHRGVVVTLDSGPVRYVVVISDEENQSWAVFKPNYALPVSLDGAGWKVRDLVKQQDLKSSDKDGRTEVAVDLITEPVTVLALYKAPPSALEIKVQGEVKAGGELVFKADASAGGQPAGALPIKVEICDAAGAVRGTLYRGAGEEIRWPVAGLESPGNWTIKVQEQLTGVSASAPVAIAAAKTEAAAAAIGEVHVVNAGHVHRFFQRTQEKKIIVEPGQEKYLPLAKKLAEQLTAAGVKTTVWETRAENYDTIPIRWYPREDEDVPRWNLVASGKLIAIAENMKPYVDTVNRAHIPLRGGYAEVSPPYRVAYDCILFSGGRLAESLRAQTAWMETPNVPGKGQGRVVVCFSPFSAGYAALALVANDEQGTTKAAAELVNYVKPAVAAAASAPGEWKALTVTAGSAAVAQPFSVYSPVRHVRQLWSTRDGKAAVCLDSKKDTLAWVDSAGKITESVAAEIPDAEHSTIDESGQVWTRTSRHLGGEWYFQEETLNCIAPGGTLTKQLSVYKGSIYFTAVPTDFQGGWKVASNGTTMLLGRLGGFQLGDTASGKWNRFADESFAPVRDSIRQPRFPVGAVFSPDSKYMLLTMDTRPVGWGGMGWPIEHPCACATFLFDVATGKPVWQLRDEEIRKATYAVHTGYGAVSNDGNISAFADYRGSVYVVDKKGAILLQEQVNTKFPDRFASGPLDGVGLALSDSGNLALAGYKNLLLVISGNHAERIKRLGVTHVAVTHDGSLAVASYENGDVEAFEASGKSKWSFSSKGVAPFLAPANDSNTLVATSDGDLVLLDNSGKETRRTHLLETTEQAKHELKSAPQKLQTPQDYREPNTLDVAKKELGAQQIAAWKPAGNGAAAYGQTFYPATEKITLTGNSPQKEAFLHLVYRRLPENKSLTVVVSLGKEGTEVFDLDLDTPEYRVVDIPVQGIKPQLSVIPTGPVEIAECALYSIKWPSPNLAYVQQSKSSALTLDDKTEESGDEESKALMKVLGEDEVVGKMKPCNIYVPNEDPDRIKGEYLRSGVDALQMLDGKRYGNAKIPPWKPHAQYAGSWLTVDFGKGVPMSLVATYERAQKQSKVNTNIAVFSSDGVHEKVLNGVVGNDQFWRVFPVNGGDVKIIGVHVIAPQDEGLSEVEAYQHLDK